MCNSNRREVFISPQTRGCAEGALNSSGALTTKGTCKKKFNKSKELKDGKKSIK